MTSFLLSGVTSDFVTCHVSVILDPSKKYEAALFSLDTYNSISIISVNRKSNSTYSTNDGVTWKTVALNTGTSE